MPRNRYGTMLLLSIFAFAVMPASAQDGTTAAEGPFSFPILQPDVAVQGEIVDDTSTQLYVFNGTEGDAVTIEMNAIAPSLDPYLILLDSDGQVLGQSDDIDENVRDSRIEDLPLPADGTYIVFASTFQNLDEFLSFNPDEPLAYEIIASGFTPPVEAPIEEFNLQSRTIQPGDIIEGETTLETPVNFYTFEASAGQVLDINMRRIEEIDPALHIFTNTGQRVAFDDDDDTAETFTQDAAVLGLTIQNDRTFLLLATDAFFYNVNNTETSLTAQPGAYVLEMQLRQPGG